MKIIINLIILLQLMFFSVVTADEVYTLGKEIFLNNGTCASCHSLKDAGTNSNIGPNLNEIRPDIGRVKNAVTNGIGIMPTFSEILSEEEINAVSYYVSESTNN
tara:strand:- start:557 stop:868 length:312 start_codon:yes stop_codon:yes gene_type:complete